MITVPMTVAVTQETIPMIITPTTVGIPMDIGASITVGNAETYDGDYIVTPQAHSETVLHTNGYIMTDNVTVIKIPYFEVSNQSGTTIYIADEV